MTLALIPPGKRKGNKYYLVYGRLAGRLVERSTGTTVKAQALRKMAEIQMEVLDKAERAHVPQTFATAATAYVAYRNPSHVDNARITRLIAELGTKPLTSITHETLVSAAVTLFPKGAAATRNREVMRPAAAILHYAATNKHCDWLRVPLFKEPRPKTRAVDYETAQKLITAAEPGPKQLLIAWLFYQAMRISDVLRVTWEDIDFERGTVSYHVGKTDRYVTKPLHSVVRALLPAQGRTGRIFPWGNKSNVYRWLRPFGRGLGVEFTPHMARHSMGTWLNQSGAGLRTIMETLDHADPKSSMRYQSADVEVIRAAVENIGKTVGKDK